MHHRWDVINKLIELRGYKHYLEIGCQSDETFTRVNAPVKTGVDPCSGGNVRMKSDEYFAQVLRTNEMFELVFIDGDHHHAQVLRDIGNALKCLSPGGAIVMHDCLPDTAEYEALNMCGTAWRAFAMYREHPGLDAITCDFDHGVGIIRRAPNPKRVRLGRTPEQMNYVTFERNRFEWMRPHAADDAVVWMQTWPASTGVA